VPLRAAVLDGVDAAFEVREIGTPRPGSGEVLVRVNASGVNPLDVKIRHGQAAHAKAVFPAVLGIDLAGVVESVGPDVDGFRPGDEVYGMTGGIGGIQGSLAELAAVDHRLLAIKPQALTIQQSAALPLVFITACAHVHPRHR
jgi:NADPH:quinone reductase-like Zn-dependent oxidoreductase